ncbi:hypothetical protein MASR1M36_01240 [Candidatus Cloacimonadaceae bacterium]
MLQLALSVLCSVLIANLLMLFNRKGKLDMLPVFLGNYFVASLFSFASLPKGGAEFQSFDLFFGILAGALFLGNFWVYQRSIVYNGLSLSVGVMRMAMIVPVLLGVLLFREQLSVFNQIGIFTGLIAFGLKANPRELHNLLWIIGLFAISGLTDASLKLYKEFGGGQEALFIYVVFSAAFGFTLLIILLGRIKVPISALLAGFALGIPNRLSTVFFLKGLDFVPAALAYPLVAVAIVLLGIISDLLFWKKQAGTKDLLLWALLLSSLLLLNL